MPPYARTHDIVSGSLLCGIAAGLATFLLPALEDHPFVIMTEDVLLAAGVGFAIGLAGFFWNKVAAWCYASILMLGFAYFVGVVLDVEFGIPGANVFGDATSLPSFKFFATIGLYGSPLIVGNVWYWLSPERAAWLEEVRTPVRRLR
jgi:hypothetical protein